MAFEKYRHSLLSKIVGQYQLKLGAIPQTGCLAL